MPLASGEGPVCLIMGPSRELVRQIHEVVQEICVALAKDRSTRYPEIRAALITGVLPCAHICCHGIITSRCLQDRIHWAPLGLVMDGHTRSHSRSLTGRRPSCWISR